MGILDLECFGECGFPLSNYSCLEDNLLGVKIDNRLNAGAPDAYRHRKNLSLDGSAQFKWKLNVKIL